jgi:predicted lipid-binding transport protein (Tim44 family)
MQRILLALFTAFLTFALITPDAEAKRMGSGRSLGMQRSAQPAPAPRQPAAAPQQAPQQAAAAGQKRPGWLGPVAGLAAGLGLAALASHLGFGEEMANFLMIALLALVAFMAIRWLLSRNQPRRPQAMQYAGIPQEPVAESTRPQFDIPGSTAPTGAASAHAEPARALPPGFDEDAFLHIAKVTFIRMQAAHDAGNLNDLREFLSPELFAEVKIDIDDRHGATQQTEVIELNPALADWADENGRQIVSVRFAGRINEDGQISAIDEIWHLARDNADARWVVAGIQQA